MISLFKLYPTLSPLIPYVSLGNFPTPVDGPFEIGPHKLWVKRDDLAGETHGGNKVRKLEVALGEAQNKGVTTLVLGGAKGSNWCVAATIYGKKLGFLIRAILFPQPITPFSERNFAFTSREAHEIVEIKSPVLLPFYMYREKKNKEALALPMGGTSPLTSLGYVNGALELKEQIEGGLLPEPDEIWIPLGTGGTVAGLVAGLKLAGLSSTIKAVRVVDRIVSNRWRTLRMARKVEGLLKKWGVAPGKGGFIRTWPETLFPKKDHLQVGEEDRSKSPQASTSNKQALFRRPATHFLSFEKFFSAGRLEVIHSAFGKGYGHPTDQGKKGMDFFWETLGIQLEPTYTGKTAGALLKGLAGEKGKNILFWNTYNSIPLPF